MIMVVNRVIADRGKGGARFIDITLLQKASLLYIPGKSPGEGVCGELSFFAWGVDISLTHIGMAKFMRND